uniref:RT_RNaseH_2 domain-containing protein n=1 Tax=Strongyloides venezuelensis TaxID=75913 RepID=A0A0K0FGM3_STRVS
MLKLEYPFYQVNIDEQSKYLTSVSKKFGNFQFNRLCYGLNESSNVIHKVIKSIFDDENTTTYYDYIIFPITVLIHILNLLEKLLTKLYNLSYIKQKKKVPFNVVNNVVNNIRSEIENYFPLKPPNYDESFVIFMDVSIYGVTSALVQDSKPIEFYTHCFEDHGKKFIDYKLAIYGLVDVLEKFAIYIYGKKVLIITVSTNPICLMTLKNISNVKISIKNFITRFNVTINYLKKSSSKVLNRINKGDFRIKEGDIGSMEDVFPTTNKGSRFFFILKNLKQFYDNNDSLKSFNFYRHNKNNRRFTYVPRVLRYTLLVKWHNSMGHGRHKCDKRTISHFKSIFFWCGMDFEVNKTWSFVTSV